MATKTITVDLEAYGRLKAARSGNESFSQVIRRVVPRPMDMDRFQRELQKVKLSDKAASAIEEQIANRRRPSGRRR